jgi:hypothetical protein
MSHRMVSNGSKKTSKSMRHSYQNEPIASPGDKNAYHIDRVWSKHDFVAAIFARREISLPRLYYGRSLAGVSQGGLSRTAVRVETRGKSCYG